jgi:hypothetical protein
MKKLLAAMFVALLMVGCGVNPSDLVVPFWIQALEGEGSRPSAASKIRKAKREKSKSLDLNSYSITDLKPLARLKNLETLHLSHNNITDLSPLAGLTNLENLNAANNEIADLKPLAGLTKLKGLYLRHNKITDFSPLTGLPKLEGFDIYGCPHTVRHEEKTGTNNWHLYWDLQSLMEYTDHIRMLKKAMPNCRISGLADGRTGDAQRRQALRGSMSVGMPVGSWTGSYEDGRKKIEVRFSRGNGKPDGKIASADAWKPNGEKCPETKVKDGNGVVVLYNEDGTEEGRLTYKVGERVFD